MPKKVQQQSKTSIHDEVIYANVGTDPDVLYGSVEPRVWTPPLRELTPETSLGFLAIEFAEDTLGLTVLPWQRWLLVHALETLPNGMPRYRSVIVLVARQSGKALSVTTPMLTVNGWSTMGDLAPGDEVYGPDGLPTRVVATTEVMHDRPCYRVTTTDGRSVIADANHLWTVQDRRRCTRRGGRYEKKVTTYQWETLTTEQLLGRGLYRDDSVKADGRRHRDFAYRLPKQEAIESKSVDLPIDPWLLGAWLGDGNSNAARLTVGGQDLEEMLELLEESGAHVISVAKTNTAHAVNFSLHSQRWVKEGSFGSIARQLGIWGNKHIPDIYLEAGAEQRLLLLQGLMDTDGSISVSGTGTARVEFCSMNRRLAEGVLYLARSLGWRATIRENAAVLNGREVGRRYRVCWTPQIGDPFPFLLSRKADRVNPSRSRAGELHAVSIESIEPVDSVPVRCIEVEREDGLYLAGRDLMVTHNSTISQILSLFNMYVLGTGLVLGTAQDLDTAEEVWSGALDMIEGNDELKALSMKPIMVNGQKTIRLKTGERYKVKAANRRAGRGLSADLILLDEIREMTDWAPYAALGATTTARPNAQIWALSNAGDAASVVLRYLRKMAHKAIGDPDGIVANEDPSRLLDPEAEDSAVEADETLGIFEWSAPPGCDVTDRKAWQQANPSLGYTITERTIESACKTMPEWVFKTEHLCAWSDGTLEGPFPAGAWDGGLDPACKGEGCDRCAKQEHEPNHPGSSIAEGNEIALCVDVNWDRTRSVIAAAGLRSDGLPHVEVIASRAGIDWVKTWFGDPEHRERLRYRVALQPNGPAGALLDELKAIGVQVVEWSGGELGRSCGRFYDLVSEGHLRHLPQPLLDVAAATAVTRPLGDAWVWDRKKSPVDCSPLVAVTGACWLIAPKPEEGPPAVTGWDEDLIAQWEREALLP